MNYFECMKYERRHRLLFALAVLVSMAAPSVGWAAPVLFATPNASSPAILNYPHVPGEVLVRFERTTNPEVAVQRILSAGGLRARRAGLHGLYLASTAPNDQAMLALMRSVSHEIGVRYVEANYLGQAGGGPDDPRFPVQWHLEQTSDVDIDAVAAWDFGVGPWDATIAVLDSGTRFDHPDLDTKLRINSGEVPNNFEDDDLNGYVDDVQGWDFVDNDNDPSDEYFHGTIVTGVAVAEVDNFFQVAGVSPSGKYVPVRVLDESGLGTSADLIQGLEYAADLGGIQLVNLSLVSYPITTGLSDAITHAASKSAVFACSGNNGPGTADATYPGAHSAVFTVGWTNPDDTLNSGSSTGNSVDFSAPGQNIASITPFPPFDPFQNSTGGGCSLAVPVVAGAASLIQSHCPSISNGLLGYFLNVGSVDLGSPGWDSGFGWGRINAANSLQAFLSVYRFCHGFEQGTLSGWSSSAP